MRLLVLLTVAIVAIAAPHPSNNRYRLDQRAPAPAPAAPSSAGDEVNNPHIIDKRDPEPEPEPASPSFIGDDPNNPHIIDRKDTNGDEPTVRRWCGWGCESRRSRTRGDGHAYDHEERGSVEERAEAPRMLLGHMLRDFQ